MYLIQYKFRQTPESVFDLIWQGHILLRMGSAYFEKNDS